MRPPLPALAAALCLLCAGASLAQQPPAQQSWVGVPELGEPTERDRERAARRALSDARALRREGRLELAEAVARRGLAANPDSAALHRELARVLEGLGRTAAARQARARADAIEPPLGPLPREPLPIASRDALVVLVAPNPATDADRRPHGWPDGEVAAELEARLRLRLPEATVVHASFESIAAARAWLPREKPRAVLSLRVDRIYCGDTLKDGRFGLASLRVGAEQPGVASVGPTRARLVLDDPRLPMGCRRELIARALERALALPSVREVLAASDTAAPLEPDAATHAWSSVALRALFPGLGLRVEAALAEGRSLLRAGRLAEAQRAFEGAARIDPDDPIVRTYLREAAATLALSRELAQRSGEDGETLDPRYSPAERASLEARLHQERRRRDELLAALAVLNEQAQLPAASVLRGLAPDAGPGEGAFGPDLARRRAGGSVEARAVHAPDGALLARYYFPEGDPLPVLREEDTDRDGAPDRWIAYAGDRRAEIWEDASDAGRPDVRLVFAGGGERLARVEIDRDGDGRPERVLHYADGALTAEALDSDADGRLDTFDHFEDEALRLREEDLDADGEIDVRSTYRNGKLVRRQFLRELPALRGLRPR